eukprot:TRINITY_DN10891_c0_g1_i1.p1 TRINITY_DN10891_c0_g1~~TRINITY_DN10891_c0_g1_i1.p1  ORF type:complete len:278 (-),score=61.28 TRINITY_DN10891_c0_g1_i1:25-858(-)
MSKNRQQKSIVDLVKVAEEKTTEAEEKFSQLQNTVSLLQKQINNDSMENVDTHKMAETLDLMRNAKQTLQTAQQLENEQQLQLDTIIKEKESLQTKLNKSEYRIKHLITYINQLEQNTQLKELQSKTNKLENRITHLLRYIDELEKNSSVASKDKPAASTTKSKKEEKAPKVKGKQQQGTQITTSQAPITNVSTNKTTGDPENTKKTVVFHWPYEGYDVRVAGTFNKWIPASVDQPYRLSPGKYEYKFIVDGNWCHDTALTSRDDNYGGRNNVIWIK